MRLVPFNLPFIYEEIEEKNNVSAAEGHTEAAEPTSECRLSSQPALTASRVSSSAASLQAWGTSGRRWPQGSSGWWREPAACCWGPGNLGPSSLWHRIRKRTDRYISDPCFGSSQTKSCFAQGIAAILLCVLRASFPEPNMQILLFEPLKRLSHHLEYHFISPLPGRLLLFLSSSDSPLLKPPLLSPWPVRDLGAEAVPSWPCLSFLTLAHGLAQGRCQCIWDACAHQYKPIC